ncbi:MAG: SDR family oxidoreductase [Deltaproteobacteria bacterium]|nr:SDR family oxidoreductase [Deltaproteobacteria bacterium]
MLVVFGAGGRCGRALVRAAVAAGVDVRPIVRDDKEARALDGVVDINLVRYADPEHPAAVAQALAGGRALVSALDPRCFGHGARRLGDRASLTVLEAAAAAGIGPLVHLCVVGAYRWSPHPLNRRSFRSDRVIRLARGLPWTLLRVSCFSDELVDGHLAPPDGGRPHPIPDSARLSPVDRGELATLLVQRLSALPTRRTLYVGGPRTWTATELRALLPPGQTPAFWPWDRRTALGALPPGDLSVLPETTRVSLGASPRVPLYDALDAALRRAPTRPGLVRTDAPLPPHPADPGGPIAALPALDADLRRFVHAALIEDLGRLGLPTTGVRLDWSAARPVPGALPRAIAGGALGPAEGLVVRGPGGERLYEGGLRLHWDALGESLSVWFARPNGAMPAEVWERLDLGVQRRARR